MSVWRDYSGALALLRRAESLARVSGGVLDVPLADWFAHEINLVEMREKFDTPIHAHRYALATARAYVTEALG